MKKFNIQDRVILDEMVDNFTTVVIEQHNKFEREGKRPIIMKNYWLQMIKQVQDKIDELTTKKALSHSNQFRNK